MIGDILADLGRETAGRLDKTGAKTGFVELNVTDDAQWEKAVAATIATLGGYDILINNAGIEITSLVVDLKAEDLTSARAAIPAGTFGFILRSLDDWPTGKGPPNLSICDREPERVIAKRVKVLELAQTLGNSAFLPSHQRQLTADLGPIPSRACLMIYSAVAERDRSRAQGLGGPFSSLPELDVSDGADVKRLGRCGFGLISCLHPFSPSFATRRNSLPVPTKSRAMLGV
jgi:Enoyl-(Acyl carrier protein) reductase